MVLTSLGLYALAVLAGMVVGIGAAFAGLGGGFLVVPMLLFAGLPVREAVGTAFLSSVITAVSAFGAHLRLKQVDLRLGAFVGIGGVAGAQVGARLLPFVPDSIFRALFASVLGFLAFRLWNKSGKATSTRSVATSRGIAWLVFPLVGLVIGIASGLTGLAGGFLLVPIGMLLGLPPALAVGTSFLGILFISTSALVAHSRLSHVVYPVGIALGIGGSLGAQAGARLVKRVSSATFRKIFAVILVSVAARMMWDL